ncbi:hypothetical protein V1525DRAFT_65632 [Lipomyces kononenkoae]|uniref:Uncharacterized protein n=1 Tax=Lipomyces kononenkoae TaxID=34357 RepID=A0ACC3SRW9_LIPKO
MVTFAYALQMLLFIVAGIQLPTMMHDDDDQGRQRVNCPTGLICREGMISVLDMCLFIYLLIRWLVMYTTLILSLCARFWSITLCRAAVRCLVLTVEVRYCRCRT